MSGCISGNVSHTPVTFLEAGVALEGEEDLPGVVTVGFISSCSVCIEEGLNDFRSEDVVSFGEEELE